MSLVRPTRWLVVMVVALTLTTGACSSDGDDSSASETSGTTVGVTLQDFSVTLDPTSVPAGAVSFEASNQGAEIHEFEIVKTDTPAADFEVSDNVADFGDGTIVDEREDIAPGTSADLSTTLEPGTYAIVCNLPEHYGLGMHADLTVE